MTDNYKEYDVPEMATALLNRAFEKKKMRVTAAFIMLLVSIFCIRELHSGWYIMENTGFSYVLSIMLFSAAILSGAILLSSLGVFKKWKFNTGALVSVLLLWGAMAFLGVFTTLYAGSANEVWIVVDRLLWYTAPMLAISLGIVILTGMSFTRGKKKS